MAVQVPTPEQLRDIAAEIGLNLTDDDVQSFIALMRPSIDAYNVVDAMPDELPRVKYPRTPGYRPQGEENKYNAWYYKTSVHGASRGKLRGKTIVLKDNVMLAGVPMMNKRRCHNRDAYSRCRWRNRGQSPLRVFLSFRRQPYQCHRPGAQSAQNGLFGRWFLLGKCRLGGGGRSGYGHRR